MADPVIMDINAELARYIAQNIDLKEVRDYFGDDLEPFSDDDLRKWFAEWLMSDGSDTLIKWYLKVGEPKKEAMARITTYALDLPEIGVSATIQCTYDENTAEQWCEVAHVEFEDGEYSDWDSEIEDLIMDIFYSL